jgi:hypothetical protein
LNAYDLEGLPLGNVIAPLVEWVVCVRLNDLPWVTVGAFGMVMAFLGDHEIERNLPRPRDPAPLLRWLELAPPPGAPWRDAGRLREAVGQVTARAHVRCDECGGSGRAIDADDGCRCSRCRCYLCMGTGHQIARLPPSRVATVSGHAFDLNLIAAALHQAKPGLVQAWIIEGVEGRSEITKELTPAAVVVVKSGHFIAVVMSTEDAADGELDLGDPLPVVRS